MDDREQKVKEMVAKMVKELAERGLLIEGGFRALLIIEGIKETEQVRTAFFAGAQHLFGSIVSILEEGTEETPADLRRIELIDRELRNWVDERP